MTLFLLMTVLAIAILALRHRANPFRGERLFQVVEDGPNSALYRRRNRPVRESGYNFYVQEYQRVTCAPGQSYTLARSGWFTNTKYSGGPLCRFVELEHDEVTRLLREQLPATRRVAREFFLRRLIGSPVQPGEGVLA